jgi:hypothetical protein
MKLQRHVKTAFAAVLLASLSAGGIAGAQVAGDTLKYIVSPGSAQTTALGGAGNFNSTLAASGFASETYSYLTGANPADDFTATVTPEMGTQQGGTLGTNGGNNRTASGMDLGSFSLQGAPGTDGSVEVIQSVTLLFYVTSASITAPNPTIGIYSGLNNTNLSATPIATFSLSASQVGSYVTIDVPYSADLFTGVTLANFAREVPQDSVNWGSEDNSTVAFQPAYRVNTVYVIPEPSAALLGALGSLVLLRRRRNG